MQQVTPISGDQIVSLAGKSSGEHDIVVGVVDNIDLWQLRDNNSSGTHAAQEGPSFVSLQEPTQLRVMQNPVQKSH